MILSVSSEFKSLVVVFLVVPLFLSGCSQAEPEPGHLSAQAATPTSGSISTSNPNAANFFYVGSGQQVTADGASGTFSQLKPTLNPKDAHTLAQLAVESLSPSGQAQQTVEAGWTVDRALNGDDDPHLFVDYKVNGTYGCYNLRPCGLAQKTVFVSTTANPSHWPGAKVTVDKTPSPTHQFAIRFFNGGWWVWYETEWIGYYPATVWGNTFSQGNYFDWYGEVATSQSVPCSQMGNGFYGSTPGSAEIANMSLFVNGTTIPANGQLHVTSPQFYAAGRSTPTSFNYGGPGGTAKQCAQNCPAPLVFPSGSTTQCTMPTPQPPGTITEFPSPSGASSFNQITAGPDGNLWFTEGSAIGRITPSGQITEFPVPTSQGVPWGITKGPDGNLWFTESFGNKIGRITPTGQVQEFPLPGGGNEPAGITTGPDGRLWFIENGFNRIGRITTDGQVSEFPTRAAGLYEITAGPDGALWFTAGISGQIGRITTDGTVTLFPLSSGYDTPIGITVGPDGNLWFTEDRANKIGRITPDGQITEFPIPTPGTQPYEIATGPDGNLWFTQQGSNQIGSMTPGGQVTEFSIPTPNSSPSGITAGPDGNIWFVEAGGRIGLLTLGT